MKVIWLDVDGVLLDYTRAFLHFTGIDTLGVTYDNLYDYDLTKLFQTPEDCQNAMLKFAVSDEFSRLEPIANKHDLEMLKNMGYSLRVITQLPAPVKAKVNRIANLTNAYGPIFDQMVFTTADICKLDFIKLNQLHGEKTILIEDNPNLIDKVEADYLSPLRDPRRPYELDVYAVKHPYNEASCHDTRCVAPSHDFSEIMRWIMHREIQ